MDINALNKIVIGYEAVMSEIKMRTKLAYQLMHGETLLGAPFLDLEAAAMNFRKIAELIVFANMTGHEDAYAAQYPNYSKEWNLGKIMNNIKAINDEYYPNAVKEILDVRWSGTNGHGAKVG